MIKRIRASLTAKLFAVTALLLLLACGMTYTVVALSLPVSYDITISDQLHADIDRLTEMLAEVTREECTPLLRVFQIQTGARVEIWDSDGQQVPVEGLTDDMDIIYSDVFVSVAVSQSDEVDAPDVISDSYAVAVEDAAGTYKVGMVESIQPSEIRQEIMFSGSDDRYEIVIKPGIREINPAEQALQSILPMLAIAILLMSLIGALVISAYVTRPLVRLSAISKKLSVLDFGWTFQTKRTDEIGVLAQSLHTLSGQLSAALDDLKGQVRREKALQKQRSAFFAAVSHELKTPLTVMQGQLEGMIANVGVYSDRDAYLQKTLEVAQQMGGMVQDTLHIFRMDQEDFAPRRDLLDVARLAREVAENHGALFESRGVALDVQARDAAMIHGDAQLLRQALGNLLDNAARYSPEGGHATLRVWTADEKTHVEIENTGAHIPEEDLPHLFEAFYRVEASRNRATGGTGLGLHVVATVMAQHGATVRIENTPSGVRAAIAFLKVHTEAT